MAEQFDRVLSAPTFAVAWVLGLLLLMEAGRRAGVRRLAREPEKGLVGLDATSSAVFALFGLLVAFAFSSATSRWDARRQLVVEEANDIATAYLRLDLLSAEAQPALRGLFRDYVDARLAAYRKMPDLEAATVELARSRELQGELWTHAFAACRQPGADPDAGKLLLPALNSMFATAWTRTSGELMHPPTVIYALLFAVGLGCALLAGHSAAASKHRSWTHVVAFALIMGVSVYVILGLEYPRMGVLRLKSFDHLLVQTRESLK